MRQITMSEALNEALREELDRDDSVFIFGESIGTFDGAFKVTKNILQDYGNKRIIDTPISENSMAGFVVGAAITGLRPILELMYGNFALPAMDQIINQASKIRYMSGNQFTVPLVIRSIGGIGHGYGAHHSDTFESFYMHVPGLKVIMPSTPYDAKGLLKSAIRDDNPVIFLEPKMLYYVKGEVPEEEYTIPIGKADIKKEGENVTLIATSAMVPRALEAAGYLEKEGISAEVIDPRTLKPLDMETIVKSVQKTNRVLIVHETYKMCGVGSEISAQIMEEAFDYLDAPIKRITGLDVPAPVSKILEQQVIPTVERIVTEARAMME